MGLSAGETGPPMQNKEAFMTETYAKAQEFAQRIIAPRAAEIDEKDEFPADIFEKLYEEGWMKLCVPVEYGGLGKGFLEHTEAVMAFSEVSGTVGICYFQHNSTVFEVLAVGSDKLKQEVFGGIVDKAHICALACSEINTGCHFYSCETTAERMPDGSTKINGVKSMVTMAGYADWYCIDCQAVGTEGISQWLVPASLEGLKVRNEEWDGFGMRGNISCPLEFNDVMVPEWCRYGNEGEGVEQILNIVAPPFILGLSALYGGITTGLMNEAVEYSMKRSYPCGTYIDGKRLCELDGIQSHLTKLYNNAYSCKATAIDAAIAMDSGEPDALVRILSARSISINLVLDSAKWAMRVVGGKGYNRANKASAVERMVRDGYAGQIMAPSADVLALWIGRCITGQSPL